MANLKRKEQRRNPEVCATHHVMAANMRRLMAAKPEVGSQMKLAAVCGLSQSTLSEMLSGTHGHEPTLDRIEKVAVALGVETWELLCPVATQ